MSRIVTVVGQLPAHGPELASTNDDDGGGSVVSAAVNPLMVVEKKGGKNKKWRVSVELSPQSCQSNGEKLVRSKGRVSTGGRP